MRIPPPTTRSYSVTTALDTGARLNLKRRNSRRPSEGDP